MAFTRGAEERAHSLGEQFVSSRRAPAPRWPPLGASEPTSKWPLEPLSWQKRVKLLRSEMAEVLENLDSVMEKIIHLNHAFFRWKETREGRRVLLTYQLWPVG